MIDNVMSAEQMQVATEEICTELSVNGWTRQAESKVADFLNRLQYVELHNETYAIHMLHEMLRTHAPDGSDIVNNMLLMKEWATACTGVLGKFLERNVLPNGVLLAQYGDYDQTPLMLVSKHNDAYGVKQLLDYDTSNINSKDQFGDTALMMAADRGNTQVVKLLVEANANLNLQNNVGKTALMLSVWKGHKDVVDLLVQAGANPDIQMMMGGTALMYALRYGYMDIMRKLIRAGANPLIKDSLGHTVLYYAKQHGQLDDVFEALKDAIE